MVAIKIVIILLLFANAYPQSDLRVAIGLVTNQAQDPYCDESFIAGYESVGGTWTGDLTILEGQSITDTNLAQSYDLITWNSGPGNPRNYIVNSSKGVQYVLPAGSNYYRTNSYTQPILDPIICGSGFNENATGYKCEFWDRDPFPGGNDTILFMTQGGAVDYTITGLRRISDSVLAIFITGDPSNSNWFEHGTPIRISNLTGTDISPLPSGLYFLSYGAANTLYFVFNTTAGTIGTTQVPTAGTFKYGTSDNNIFIRTSHWNIGQLFGSNVYPFGYSLYNVTGFQFNPNGIFQLKVMSPDGFGDKMEFTHTLGTGAYTGGGRINFSSQSYGTPYIAGLIAFIKDSVSHIYNRECTWWEARYRARITASGNNVYDQYSGYGRINTLAAINYLGSIPIDPNSIIGNIGTLTATRTNNIVLINFDTLSNGVYYDIYNQDTIIKTYNATQIVSGFTFFYDTIQYVNNKRFRNEYSYKVRRGDTTTARSNIVKIPYFMHSAVRVKPQ